MNTPGDIGDEGRDELMRAARRLPRGIAPQRDLWPGIEKAIAEPARPSRFRWNKAFAQAAAVLLLVGGSSGITWLAMKQNQQAQPVVNGVQERRFETVAGNFGGKYNLGPDFMEARDNLASRMNAKLASLSPETRAAVEKNIADIRAAIDEINRALANEPDNALLQDLLLSAYREELTLMQKVDGLASSVMRRNDI
jgi:hypothetical protein